MTDVRSLNRDVAKQQPAEVFATPLEIVSEVLLTKGEKLATHDAQRQRIVAIQARACSFFLLDPHQT